MAGYKKVFWNNIAISGAATLIGSALVAALGHWLLKLYGEGFTEAYTALLILLLAAIFEGFALGMFQAIQSQGRMWSTLFLIVLPRDVLVVVFALLLIQQYGLLGLAVAYSGAWIVGSLLTALYAFVAGLKVEHS